ncbi:hypothetical protein [Paraburkholderia sp.]|uniref:hypothetical protein n=1 Tax=Paraburkholderia sp. TaxID=1926495 RepID=UPI0039E555E8
MPKPVQKNTQLKTGKSTEKIKDKAADPKSVEAAGKTAGKKILKTSRRAKRTRADMKAAGIRRRKTCLQQFVSSAVNIVCMDNTV